MKYKSRCTTVLLLLGLIKYVTYKLMQKVKDMHVVHVNFITKKLW